MSHENAQNRRTGILARSESDSTEHATVKTCYECGEEKPLSEFGFVPHTPDGRVSKCNDCRKPPKRLELLFPDASRRPMNLPDQLIRDIRNDRGKRGNMETNADEKGLSINALVSKYSDVYYDKKKYTLTWRIVRDILTRRTYDDVG